MTTALTRADVLILLYAGMAAVVLFFAWQGSAWLFWRAVDHYTASTTEDLAEPDHAVCENPDCDTVLCYCGNPDLCPGTEAGRCGHHLFLCDQHAHVDCWDCRYDAQVERDQLFAREHLGEWS